MDAFYYFVTTGSFVEIGGHMVVLVFIKEADH